MGCPSSTSLMIGKKVLDLFGKSIFAYWVRLKIKQIPAEQFSVINHLKPHRYSVQRLYCTVIYSLYRKIVHGPGWSKISVYSNCGDLHGSPASVIESLHKRALEIHHWAMHVEMRADSVSDHVALFLARKSHLKQNLSMACRGLFWKMKKKKKTKPSKAFPPKGST